MTLGVGQQLSTAWFLDLPVSYADMLLRPWEAPWTVGATTPSSQPANPTTASDAVFENWWWGAQAPVVPVTPPSQAGGGPGKLSGKKRRKDGPYMRDGQVFGEEYQVSPQAGPGQGKKAEARKIEILPSGVNDTTAWGMMLDTTFTDLDE